MASAAPCIGLTLEEVAPACGITDTPPDEQTAFQQLRQSLRNLREGDGLPLHCIYAAVAASRSIPWPAGSLLRDTLLLLSRATEGAHTRMLQDAEPPNDAVMEDGDDTSDAAKETFSLGLTLLCHALRHAAEGCSKGPSKKQADQAAAASQWQVCQKIGLPALLANLDAVSQEHTLLSVFDQLQAAKLIYTTTIMMALHAPSLRALAQPFLGILCRPFRSTTDTSQPAAVRHLRLLLSFCHSKQHSGAAIALLTQVIKHVHVTEHQPRASVSILAAIADAIETDTKKASGDATPQHLEENLTVLWEAAQQIDHGPTIVYALLAKVLPILVHAGKASIRKMILSMAAACTQAQGPHLRSSSPGWACLLSCLSDKDATVRAKALQATADAAACILDADAHAQGEDDSLLLQLMILIASRLLDNTVTVRKKALLAAYTLCSSSPSSAAPASPGLLHTISSVLCPPLFALLAAPPESALASGECKEAAAQAIAAIIERMPSEQAALPAMLRQGAVFGVESAALLKALASTGLRITDEEWDSILTSCPPSEVVQVKAALPAAVHGRLIKRAHGEIHGLLMASSPGRRGEERLAGVLQHLQVLEACGALSHSDQDAAAETCLLLSLTEALLQEREGSHHNPTSLLEKTGLQGTGSSPVVLAQSEQDGHAEAVTAGSSESQLDKPVISSAEAQLEKAIIHALKCLSKGGDKLQVAEVAQRVTGFVLASFDRMVAACNPAVWEAALQVLCMLPDAHRAVQKLLARQLTALRHAAEPACERQWTCFLVVLGALGRSMQAEKRAFLARVAAARGLELPEGGLSPAGEAAPEGFDYMQTEDQRRSDEAAAQAYVATLLQQSGLAAFLPVLQEMAGAPGVPLCMRVASLRSLSSFAAVSEEAAGQLRLVLITLLGATERADPISTGPACVEDPASSLHQTASGTLPCQKGGADGAPPHNSDDDVAMESESPDMEEQTPAELLVEALCAARQLLGSFPGMQNDVLPLIGSIFSRQTGRPPRRVQQAAAFCFARLLLAHALCGSQVLGCIGAGACSDVAEVAASMRFVLRVLGDASADRPRLFADAFAQTPLPQRAAFAEVLLEGFLRPADLAREPFVSAVLQCFTAAGCAHAREAAAALLSHLMPTAKHLAALEEHLRKQAGGPAALGTGICSALETFKKRMATTGGSRPSGRHATS